MGESTELQSLSDELRFQRAMAVIQHHLATGDSLRRSCEVCSVPERTFYRWVSEGVLADYLEECRDSRSQAASAMAAEAIPDVVQYMVGIATGQVKQRGANPIAAAKFVLAIAGGEQSAAPRADTMPANVLAFMPQMVTFNVVQGTPATDDQGRLEVIEGQVVAEEPSPAAEIPPPGENSPEDG